MRYSRSIILLTYALLIAGCIDYITDRGTIIVQGTVVDAQSRKPLEKVHVCMERYFNDWNSTRSSSYAQSNSKALSDLDGHFSLAEVVKFSGIDSNTFNTTLSIIRDGYIPYQSRYFVDPILTDLRLELYQSPGRTLPHGRLKNISGIIDSSLKDPVVYFSFAKGTVVSDEQEADLAFRYQPFNLNGYEVGQNHMLESIRLPDSTNAYSLPLTAIQALAAGGIAPMPMRQFNSYLELSSCATPKFFTSISLLEKKRFGRTSIFCVRTRDGAHYAKFLLRNGISDMGNFTYQPDGSADLASDDMRTITTCSVD